MARFLKSASNSDQWIDDQTSEICFIGRSNVGKSSLINALADQKIAKTSKTPGRTQLVNFYDFDKFRLIDLPGYGFAKVSKAKQLALQEMIYEYLFNRVNLYAVFQICDANTITGDDQKFSKLVQEKFVNYFVILNKIDKLSKKTMQKNLDKIAHKLHVDLKQIILVSAKKRTNINVIFKTIDNLLKSI